MKFQTNEYGEWQADMIVDPSAGQFIHDKLVSEIRNRPNPHGYAPVDADYDDSFAYLCPDYVPSVGVTLRSDGYWEMSVRMFAEHEGDDALDGTLPPPAEPGTGAIVKMASVFIKYLKV